MLICGAALGDERNGSVAVGEVPAALLRSANCMLDVLKSTRGVQNPKLGIVTSDGWTHPFLEYDPSERARWIQPTRFEAVQVADIERGPYVFRAIVPGLKTTVEERLDIHVTEKVVA